MGTPAAGASGASLCRRNFIARPQAPHL